MLATFRDQRADVLKHCRNVIFVTLQPNLLRIFFLAFSFRYTLHGPGCGEGVLRSLHGHKHSVPPAQQDGRQVGVPLHRGVQDAE